MFCRIRLAPASFNVISASPSNARLISALEASLVLVVLNTYLSFDTRVSAVVRVICRELASDKDSARL